MNAPVVKAQMLIRKPVAEVFEAFVDPAVTTKFWFTHSTGRLEPGKEVRWDWAMYGASAQVRVKEIEPNRRILIEWPDHFGVFCPVEWLFTPRADGTTFVTISTWGFSGSEDQVVGQAIDSMGGFSLLLAGAKAQLEHNIALNLTGDHAPDAHKQ
ncbi:MAG TPA: SRPBCC family protein [Symbiobacteriaceae bacterium]|nr:SRPBCC family protein [Symbiobacteriaceae bacterium]